MISPGLVDRAVAQIRKSAANYEYFFENLSSPEWLGPLRNAGFFTAPPELVREGEYISFPAWPESRYLARMAAIESAAQLVYSIASKVPPTENVRVHHDLAEVALALPPKLGARFVPLAKVWIASPYQLLLPEQLGRLLQRLAENGKIGAALDLAKALLQVVPQSPSDPELGGRREVRAHFDMWHYERILKEHVPSLVRAGGDDALSMFCELLDSGLALSNPERGGRVREDYSWIWHPAIEDHEQNSGHSPLDALVAGVRDAAEQVVRRDVTVLAPVIAELESRRWTVFRRIALYLVAKFVDSSMAVAEARLTDRKLFDDVALKHEYYNLARAAFPALPAPAQETVLSFIEQGPDMDAVARWLRDSLQREPSKDELVRYQRSWQLEHLSAVKDALPPLWTNRYQQWSREYGEPEHPDFASYHSSVWVGATSPRSAEELRSLGPEELVQHLNSWQPSGQWGGPSREGLANELQAVVASDPMAYSASAAQFRHARPIFVRAFVSGLQTATGQGKRFEWTPVLELFSWVGQQEVKRTPARGGLPEEDPDLGWTRKAIADFTSDALAHDERAPPYSMRGEVWRVLRPLTDDPDPTPEDDERYGPPNMSWFTLSLNTTRGQALQGVVNYVHWVSRHSPTKIPGEGGWLSECPEARDVLERHLHADLEPSPAVRSVFGRWLPTLGYLDIEWLKAHLKEIFPADPQFQRLRDAAWDSFVVFCNPQRALLPLLRGEYERAVHALPQRSALKHGHDPDERLADHLMVLYWWGDLDLVVGSLLRLFFSTASERLREHAMGFIGRSLCGPEAPPREVVQRLQALWAFRFETAKSRPGDHVQELAAFGWWFASGKFDDEWALTHLRAVVRLTGKIEMAHKVVERLADVAKTRPLDSLEAFDEIVEADKQGWVVSLAREHAERLLRDALTSSQSRDRAIEVLHRLGARGHAEFRKLLGSGSGRENPDA